MSRETGTAPGTDTADIVRGAAGMPEPSAAPSGENASPSLDDLEEAMRDVVDPELGINVVDLGLVYDIRLDDRLAVIDMTLTSAACPLTDVIEDQTRSALVGASGEGGLVDDFTINCGYGGRRGVRKSSPRTAGSSSGRSASPSDRGPGEPPPPGQSWS